jgi:energy-coupling factor transport system ATP-binding protein
MLTDELRGIDISYGVLNDLDFSLKRGEVVALMGPNGAGKSTLARILAGLIEATSGEIQLVKDGEIKKWTEVKRWQEIGIIGQHPRRQTIGATVAEELGFGLQNLGLDAKEVRRRVRALSVEIGLEEQLNQSPATLSGGERQRLVLAAILALEPSFLLLDEALTMLDERAQESCLKLLQIGSTSGSTKTVALPPPPRLPMGQLWITHDPELARKADRLLVMKRGKLLDCGKPNQVLDDAAFCEEFCIRYGSSKNTDSQGLERWEKYDSIQKKRVIKPLSGLSKTEKSPILSWQEAIYESRLKLTQGIRSKEFIGVLGPSGAGKSTLLDSAVALIKPDKGKFLAFGEEISKHTINFLRQKIRLMLQEPGEYQIGTNIYHEVFYLQSRKERKENLQENLEYLEVFGIPHHRAYAVQEHLSGGERQRVALAAALESLPEVLLVDEPLLGLDAQGRHLFRTLLRELTGKITIVYVTHDVSEVAEFADRLWLIEEGKLTMDCLGSDWPLYTDQFKSAGVRFSTQEGAKR